MNCGINDIVGCRQVRGISRVGCALILCTLVLQAQTRSAPSSGEASVRRGIELVETGRCAEALPLLERGLLQVTDKSLRYQAQMAGVRCAMAVGNEKAATDNLFRLQRENPGDPEVMYWETHIFSEIGTRVGRELVGKYPDSYQAQRLQAESLESAGKDEDAAAIYRKILEAHPKVDGIHYRLGQIALAQAGDAGPTDAAREEFEKELAIDPNNASAEFILGELARRKGDWAVAEQHFSRATHLDVGFSEAYLALGMSYAAESKFAEAKPPLEHYVLLEPNDPAGHYQLAVADARTGDEAGAKTQMALQAEAAAHSPSSDTTQGHPIRP